MQSVVIPFCWSMLYVLLFYLIVTGFLVIFLHFEQRWIHLNVPQAFRPRSDTITYVWHCTRHRPFKFKTGLPNISDQHLLKIKNYGVHGASRMSLLEYRRPSSSEGLQECFQRSHGYTMVSSTEDEILSKSVLRSKLLKFFQIFFQSLRCLHTLLSGQEFDAALSPYRSYAVFLSIKARRHYTALNIRVYKIYQFYALLDFPRKLKHAKHNFLGHPPKKIHAKYFDPLVLENEYIRKYNNVR